MSELHKPKKSAALFLAAVEGNQEECTRLVERERVDINVRDDKRFATPLMYAASNSRVQVVKYLIGKNAKIALRDNAGWDALTWCCWGIGAGRGWVEGDSLEVIILLVQGRFSNKADLLHTTDSGYTPLMTYVKHLGLKVNTSSDDKKKKKAKASEKASKQLFKEMLSGLRLLIPDFNKDPKRAQKLVEMENNFGEKAWHLCTGKRAQDIRRELTILVPSVAVGDELDIDEVPDIVEPFVGKDNAEEDEEKAILGDSDGEAPPSSGLMCCGSSGRPKAPKNEKATGLSRIRRQKKISS